MILKDWQNTEKSVSDFIIQASSKDGLDSWQPFPIGMSWTFIVNYRKGKTPQIGSHNNLVISAFCTGTFRRRANGVNRESIANTLASNGIYTGKINSEDYFSLLPSYKFVISPEGVGIDCHRHYEALMAGCIPIMENDPLTMEKYSGCPILWTTDYSEITPEYLEAVYPRMLDTDYDFSCLFLSKYTPEQQAIIRECGNFWIKDALSCSWY